MSTLTILIAVLVLVVLFGIVYFNKFVRLSNQAKEAWSDIEVQLRRRYDLIPNLVSAVKGYMTHEAGTFEKITEARSRAMQAENPHEKGEAENMLSGALKSLFAVAENYPDLKANTNFLELQRELSDTENKIQSSRRFYNTTVRDLNIAVESFPGNVLANIFGYKKMDLFDLPDGDVAQNVPEVKF